MTNTLQAFELFPFFSGLRWLSVHLITLGALAEAVFGVLPWLTARLAGRGKPRTRWDIWILLKCRPAVTHPGNPGDQLPLDRLGRQLVIVLSAPLFFLFLPGVSAAGVEQTAPLVLIYGWMLQFGYAVVPYFLRRAVSPNEEAGLGGSWFSLAAVHLGGIFLLASIVVSGIGNQLLGVAFLMWSLSVLPAVKEVVGILITRVGHDRKVEL